MDWDQYLKDVMVEESYLDNIKVSIDEYVGDIPNIVKASVYLLEKMITNQGRKNVIVFPEGDQLPFLFMVSKLIYNLSIGKIENDYSPERFKKGQILKLGDCICEFIKVDKHPIKKDKSCIYLKFADVDSCIVPLEAAPYFQISDTKKKLSKKQAYVKEKKESIHKLLSSANNLQELKNIKTHVNGSVFYVSSIASCERNFSEIQFDDESVHEYFFISKTDYSGTLINYKGKYMGIPALIISSQISQVNEAIESGSRAQSVIINLIDCHINDQLESLDTLLEEKIPVVCITNTLNSFELNELEIRGFNIWRWDKNNISETIQSSDNANFAKTIDSCVKAKVFNHHVNDSNISEAFSFLYKFKNGIANESANVSMMYTNLFSIAYLTVRRIHKMTEDEKEQYDEVLTNCQQLLEHEKDFMTLDNYYNFMRVINFYKDLVSLNIEFPKEIKLYQVIKDITPERPASFYIICSNRDDPKAIRQYWKDKFHKIGYAPNIKVMHIKDFMRLENVQEELVFVVGWLSASVMKKLIYSYKVKYIHVLLYECEERWRRSHSKVWSKGLDSKNNKKIVRESFSREIKDSGEDLVVENINASDEECIKEQDDLDLILQENKYRQYTSKVEGAVDSVDAVPVGFVGGGFSLYTPSHTILVATKIIEQLNNKIEKKCVGDLKVGDFIVVRETSKDIIRDVADMILEVNNKIEFRNVTSLWQEPLRTLERLSSTEEVILKLRASGCKRNDYTIKNWINEDVIIPQQKEDLEYIADATNDRYLKEHLDEIYDKARYVLNAHVRAGTVLSERLTDSIAKELCNKKIDPFNIWDPIELQLEEVGTVKILKITDISSSVLTVNKSDTNHILSEEKGALLWLE